MAESTYRTGHCKCNTCSVHQVYACHFAMCSLVWRWFTQVLQVLPRWSNCNPALDRENCSWILSTQFFMNCMQEMRFEAGYPQQVLSTPCDDAPMHSLCFCFHFKLCLINPCFLYHPGAFSFHKWKEANKYTHEPILCGGSIYSIAFFSSQFCNQRNNLTYFSTFLVLVNSLKSWNFKENWNLPFFFKRFLMWS